MEDSFQGARNAGRPLLLEGGLDWKPLSLTPAELDFVAAKGVAAREIALAFGVPPLLLGLPGDNTHANFAEANRAFWRQTAIPLVRRSGAVAGAVARAGLRRRADAGARSSTPSRRLARGAGIALAPARRGGPSSAKTRSARRSATAGRREREKGAAS